jgi:DNA-directed RNA polymerase subunit RPC12/RpoP
MSALPTRSDGQLSLAPALHGGFMTQHEFFCQACRQTFSEVPTPDDEAEGVVACPHCGSERVEERPTAFYPVRRRESA